MKMSSLFPEIVLNLIYLHFSLTLWMYTDPYMNTDFFFFLTNLICLEKEIFHAASIH